MLLKPSIALAAVLLAGWSVSPAPWAPVTHLHLAEIALQDAIEDGVVTICRVDGEDVVGWVGDYAVSPPILKALRGYESHFRAGVLGPDAYPDIATGQRVIHPRVSFPTETRWSPGIADSLDGESSDGTDAWLSHLWRDAFRSPEEPGWQGQTADAWRAFVVGYLVHGAGDMFGHTYVNYYAGGPFQLGPNAAKHITIERLVGKRTPEPAGGVLPHHADQVWTPLYTQTVLARRREVLRERLLVGPDAAQMSIPRIFSDLRNELESLIEAYGNDELISRDIAEAIGANFDEQYARAWLQDIEEGLRAWPKFSHEISKAVFFPDAYPDVSVGEVQSDYVNNHLLSMLGFPDEVGGTLAALSDLQEMIIPEFVQNEMDRMRRNLFEWLFEQATGMEWETFKDPETFFDDIVNTGGGRQISLQEFDATELGFDRIRNIVPGFGGSCGGPVPRTPEQGFDYRAFPPAYNTVVMTKLAFLGRQEANRLLGDLGGNARLAAENAMLGFVTSLDESNQWVDGPQMAFAREPEVFWQIFMKQRGQEDASGVIAGHVTEDSTGVFGNNGEPLANVRAEVFRVEPNGEERMVRFGGSRADGNYQVAWLEEGEYHVYFRPPRLGYVAEWWDNAQVTFPNVEGLRIPVPVTYEAPADTINAALEFRPVEGQAADLTTETDPLCVGSAMMSAVPPDFRDFHQYVPLSSLPVVAAMNPDFVSGAANPFTVWESHERQLISDGLMPQPGNFQLSGLVSDGGSACVEPVGDNFMLEAEVGMVSQEEMMTKVQARMEKMMQNPAEMQEMARMMQGGGVSDPRTEAISKALGFPIALPPAVMRDLEGSAMFEVYSPNGVSWIMGSLLAPTADMPIYEHDALGGWRANAASQLWIVLPGTTVSSLEVGETYAAIVPQLGTDPLYVRSEGEWTTRDPKLYECSWKNPQEGFTRDGPFNDEMPGYRDVLEGELSVVEPSELQGTLTVEAISGGSVTARFDLSGEATHRVHEYKYFHSNDGLGYTCEYGGMDKVVRTDRQETIESTGPIRVQGTLTAPASTAMTRPGRRIAQTRVLPGRD